MFWPSVEFFNAFAAGTITASVADGEEEGDAFFLDSDGNPTTIVSGDAAEMSVVPYLEADKDYSSSFITADATANDLAALAELTDSTSSETEDDEAEVEGNKVTLSNSSSSGCNSGFALSSMLLLMFGLTSRKKR